MHITPTNLNSTNNKLFYYLLYSDKLNVFLNCLKLNNFLHNWENPLNLETGGIISIGSYSCFHYNFYKTILFLENETTRICNRNDEECARRALSKYELHYL